MMETQTETQSPVYDVEYPSVEKWFKQKKSVSSNEFYKFYLERSEYKMSKKEWMEFMKSFSTNFFDFLSTGSIFVLPYFLGELSIRKIKVSGKQINWNESKKRYKELTGKDWKKGDSLEGCFVYHEGARIKDSFNIHWRTKSSSKVKYQAYWKFHISSRYQWKRLLKIFTEFPAKLNNLKIYEK